MRFPAGFVFGAATAAYQIEGAADEDGRGWSIWDTFCRTPGAVTHGDTGDIACDHYHRTESDLDLAAQIGLTGYRFSIAWPRIVPDGTGAVNQKGIDFYRRLADEVRARGMDPVVTLYHWDLPQPLQDAGGWASRDTVERFCEYVRHVTDGLGDAVGTWVTINEPFCAGMIAHLEGRHAPGLTDLGAALAASHHLLLAHGRAVDIVRAGSPGRASASRNCCPTSPRPRTPKRTRPPRGAGTATRTAGSSTPCCAAPTRRTCSTGTSARCPWTSSATATWRPSPPRPTSSASTTTRPRPWPPTPPSPGTRRGCSRAPAGPPRAAWTCGRPRSGASCAASAGQTGLPLYVTENGAAFHDYVDPEGQVKDTERVAYLSDHFAEVLRAIEAGVDVRGYFVWSLLDNLEWADGYSRRFGLIFVDFGTQSRIPKASARWYQQLIASQA